MYLHLGGDTVIIDKDILGIFDIDTTTVSKKTRDYLNKAEKNGKIIYVSQDLPKAFIITADKNVYITNISPQTLLKRTKTNLSV